MRAEGVRGREGRAGLFGRSFSQDFRMNPNQESVIGPGSFLGVLGPERLKGNEGPSSSTPCFKSSELSQTDFKSLFEFPFAHGLPVGYSSTSLSPLGVPEKPNAVLVFGNRPLFDT